MKADDVHALLMWLSILGVGVSAGLAAEKSSIGVLAFCLSLMWARSMTKVP